MSTPATTNNGLSHRERKLALTEKREAKKQHALRHGFTVKRGEGETRIFPRADGITDTATHPRRLSTLENVITGKKIPVIRNEETGRMEAANRMISLIIRRIEFPKKGFQFVFSPTDREDARAAGMLACVEFGFFDHGNGGIALLKKIRSAIQGRDCLRLRCTWETGTATPEKVAESVGFVTSEEIVGARLKPRQVKRARAIMQTLRHALASDGSRKARQNFRSNRDFFLITLSLLTGKSPRSMSANNFSKRKTIFLDYLEKGEKSAPRPPEKSLVDEIRIALETAFMS
jgi:hypothetical protein